MENVVRVFKALFERGASVREILKEEGIKVRRENLPADVGAWCVRDSATIHLSSRLSLENSQRQVVHELGHLKGLDESEAKVLAELYLLFKSRSVPGIDVLLLVAIGIQSLMT